MNTIMSNHYGNDGEKQNLKNKNKHHCDYTVEYEHLGFKYLRSEFPHLNSGNFLNRNPWRINKSHTKPYLIEATEQATTAV